VGREIKINKKGKIFLPVIGSDRIVVVLCHHLGEQTLQKTILADLAGLAKGFRPWVVKHFANG